MIKQISKLKDFGIFSDFKCSANTVREFKRFNLIYGWNGSGKSTLTKLFSCLEKKKLHEDFLTADFNITVEGHTPISHNNLGENSLNIRVFNQDFVSDNIEWDHEKTARSILILSEEKIEERKRLELLTKEIAEKSLILQKKQIQQSGEEKAKETFLSATAKTIKEAFKIIDTRDTHYFNYSKPKLEAFIEGKKDKLKSQAEVLGEVELKLITTSIKPSNKALLVFELSDIDLQPLILAESKIKNIIKSDVVNDSIERLKENPDLQDWVSKGIELHEKYSSSTCEYCGQKITEDRIELIKRHFNDAYFNFLSKIEGAINWLSSLNLGPYDLPDASSLYEELLNKYLLEKDFYLEKISEINKIVAGWRTILSEKRNNPFATFNWEFGPIENKLRELNDVITEINLIKTKHNTKTNNFDLELKGLKTKLETHYATESLKEGKFFDLVEKISSINKEVVRLTDEIKTLRQEAFDIEKVLTDEVKGAAEFNELLHAFLGRDDISLHFVEAEKGYKITRKGSTKRARNLSEGEKTAIAFIYFIIKLRENGNEVSNTIVTIDDPVSSLDSNHLIHAYSFLKNHCNEVKQLFVLTHNFHFFKLVRDWIFYVSAKEGDKNYYTIDSSTATGIRQSVLADANNFLLKYNSEYHYLFYKLNEYSKKDNLDLDDMFVIANMSRRFIESLITFKFPKKTKDIWEKFKKVKFDETLKTKVYKFINLYSHNDKIESHETFGDNLFAEGKPLVAATLEFIKAVDEEHYNELLSIYSN